MPETLEGRGIGEVTSTQVLVAIVALVALGEVVALGGLIFGHRRVRNRESHLGQLWDRHRRAVENDVAYLHQWQDFLSSYAGDISEGERG